jgi:hypothetical protein
MTAKKDPKDLLPPAGGQPTKYKPEYCEQLLKHFDVQPYKEVTKLNEKTGNEYQCITPNDLPTLAGFCRKIGIGTNTIANWARQNPEFLVATARAKAIAESILVVNALHGHYNPQFSQFVAKNYTDMRDVKELHVGEVGQEPQSTAELKESIADLDRRIAEAEERL